MSTSSETSGSGTPPSPGIEVPHTPPAWRPAIVAGIILLFVGAWMLQSTIGERGQAVVGVVCFIGMAAVFSSNLRAVNWRTIGGGFALQVFLILFVIKFEIMGVRPGYRFFQTVGEAVGKFLSFTDKGSEFVFGHLAGPESRFIFAFKALPTIIFTSAFFSLLYYLRILQWIVRILARVMVYLMRTSGAESLAAAANVFMGQTEAPLIVKPYVARMTRSELLALMVGGMATISGGVMAVYIQMGADPVAILATSVMAAPCSLYLAKIVLPETEEPETRGQIKTEVSVPHRNFVDAVSAGASDGLTLALNVAAMLIAFLALLAMTDYLLAECSGGRLSLQRIFSFVFAPVAFLMGGSTNDVPLLADLLGNKLVANEFVAYVLLTNKHWALLDQRGYVLATYALTGFANIASIGIQIGGIGAMAPERRGDLASLGGRALLAGFLATLVNASLASLFLEPPIQLTSPSVASGDALDEVFPVGTICPTLEWQNVPRNTRTFVIVGVDADALNESGKPSDERKPRIHWAIYNVPSDVREIPADFSEAAAAEMKAELYRPARMTEQTEGDDPHRYAVKIYALDQRLEFDPKDRLDDGKFRDALKGHILAGGQLRGLLKHRQIVPQEKKP